MAREILTYIPMDDVTGYLIQMEHNKMYAREVSFHFSLGYHEELSKHLLIDGCEKMRTIDSISYLEEENQLVGFFN